MKLLLKNVKIGDMVRISSNIYTIYGYNKNDLVPVTMKLGNSIYVTKSGYQQISVTINNIEASVLTKEDLIYNIEELEKQIENHKDKLNWMEETGNETYDETEVKVWKTLKTLNSSSSDVEKAKVIAKLING